MEKPLKFTDMFQKSCTKYYGKTCVMYYEDVTIKKITYSEMYGIFDYIYTLLNLRSIFKYEIGLCMKRNPLIPAIIAAIHRCESSFMFLDAQDRQGITYLVDLGIPYAITVRESDSLDNFGFPLESELMVSILGFTFQLHSIKVNEKFLVYDHGKIAYHVQTSGSTGTPKIIAVPHECIKPNVEDFKNLFNLSEKDVIYFSTPLTFDPSMIELYLVIYTGCSLLIAPDNLEVLFPFGDSLDYTITFWQTTPSKLNMWSNSELHNVIFGAYSSLRVLLIGGEECQSIVRRIRQVRHPDNKTLMFNVYGVTEMSCWATISEIELTSDAKVPIGKCLSETEVNIFDDSGKLINTGTGKIKIGSKTRKCIFGESKVQQENDIVWIDTGDLGEIDEYGQIFFLGRNDDVIKRFGHKVNLNHIEMVALASPYINQCTCFWKTEKNILILFFTLNDNDVGDLLEDIKRRLPKEEWPDEVHHIERMPLNRHGKICKRSLDKMYDDLTGGSGRLNIQEYFISEVLNSLGKTTFDSQSKLFESSFIDLGGNSFCAIALVNKLEQFCMLKFPKLLLSLMNANTSIKTCLKILRKVKQVNIEMSSSKIISSKKERQTETKQFKQLKLLKTNENSEIHLSISWKYNLGKCVDSRPSVFTKFNGETIIVIGSHSGFVAILNAEKGTENGLLNVTSRVEAPVHCKRVMALLKDCGVVGCYDGSLWCFCLHTSEVIWKINLKSMIKSEVCSLHSSLFVASYDAFVRMLNFEDGSIMQTIKIGNGGISADLLLCEDAKMLFVGTLSGICAGLDILQTVVTQWEKKVESPIFVKPAMLAVQSCVVFAEVNGKIHCLKSSSGETVWTFSDIQGNIFSSIFVEQNLMYFGCHDENIYCLTLMKDNAILKWKLKLKGKIYLSPNVHNQRLLVASHLGNIYTIDKEHLNFAVMALPAETFSTPVIYENTAYVGCRDDHVYSLKIKQNH